MTGLAFEGAQPLADLCRLRNLIIHRSEKAKQTSIDKATLLPNPGVSIPIV